MYQDLKPSDSNLEELTRNDNFGSTTWINLVKHQLIQGLRATK